MGKLVRAVALAAAFLVCVPATAGAASSAKKIDYDPVSMEAANVGQELAVARFATQVNNDAFARLVQGNELAAWILGHSHVQTIPNVTHSSRVTTSAPTYSGGGGGGCAYEGQIRAAFGSAGDWAMHIVQRESGCTASAYNRSGASGLFQLLGHQDLINAAGPGGSAFDPACNIAAAKMLYDSSGRAPWGG